MKKVIKTILVISAAGVIMFLSYFYSDSRREKIALDRYGDIVTKYGFEYNVDGNLVLAVIKAESNFNESAVSHKGAVGLMQIMPETGEFIAKRLREDYSESLLYNYDTNIKYGTYFLSYLSGRFEDFDSMLAAYNAGEGNVRYWLEKYSGDGVHLKEIPFKETKNYIIKVKAYYNEYKKKYNY